MKKINILTFLIGVCFLTNSMAAKLNPYWHSLPEESGYQKLNNKAASNDKLGSVDDFIGNYVEVNQDAFDEQEDEGLIKANGGWGLKTIETSIALGLGGTVGMFSWGGTKAIRVFWKKRSKKDSAPKLNDDSNLTTVVKINQKSSREELDKQLNPLIKSLVKSKKVKDEKKLRENLKVVVDNFYSYSKGMNTAIKTKWYPKKLRLDFVISATGTITPIFVNVGAETRVRLEWVRLMGVNGVVNSNDKINLNDSKIVKSTRKLMNQLSEDLTVALEEKGDLAPKKYGFELSTIHFCVTAALGGKIAGIASVGGSITPWVFFGKHNMKMNKSIETLKEDSSMALIADNSEENLRYADKANLKYKKDKKKSVFKMRRKYVRKGLKKALKFAKYFSKKVHKKAKRKPRSKWGVAKIISLYKLSLGGKIGPVKLTATPSFGLHFVNKGL